MSTVRSVENRKESWNYLAFNLIDSTGIDWNAFLVGSMYRDYAADRKDGDRII